MGTLDHSGGSSDRTPLPQRPDPFSTYAPRDLVLQLKVIAAIHDLPLWSVVTDALRQYLERYEKQHGRLPRAAAGRSGPRRRD